jgi:hypothetical protein
MIPLDSIEKWFPILDEAAHRFLNASERQDYQSIPDGQRKIQLKALLEKPIAHFSVVNDVYFRARWAEVLEAVCPTGPDLKVLEVASGDADMIPQVMDRVCPRNTYITANMNRKLTRSLLDKTRDLALKIDVFEADAIRIGDHIAPESVDVVAFQHAINDVIQAILCEREGIDTVEADWMETLPAMIAILQREVAQNTLERHAKEPFLGLLSILLQVMKKGGVIVMNHYQFQLDLDWGYPPDLFEGMVPMVRAWVQDLMGCKEVFYPGFDPQWWLFLQKV